ncbi:hypothetical protein MD484_g1918, partial [Candolleomyces efflorescens]
MSSPSDPPTITIEQPTRDEVALSLESPDEYDTTTPWLHYPFDVTHYGPSVSQVLDGNTLAVPSADSVWTLTDGAGSAQTNCNIDIGDLQLNETLPVGADVGSAPNTLDALPFLDEMPFYSGEVGDTFLDPSSFAAWPPPMQTAQWYPRVDNAHLQIADASQAAESRLPPGENDHGGRLDKEYRNLPAALFTTPSNSPTCPPVSPYSSLTPPSPYSPQPTSSPISDNLTSSSSPYSFNTINTTSPLIGIPSSSSSSSFVSLPNTSALDDGDILKTDSIMRRSRQAPTSPTRGRSVGRGRHTPSASSSRQTSPYRRLSRSPNPKHPVGDFLEVPQALTQVQHGQSSLMGESSSPLSRRHSFGAVTRSRPSSSHVRGAGSMGNIDGFDLAVNPSAALTIQPSGLAAPSGAIPQGSRVASDAIIAACNDRRTREAKFICNICFQTFTAKHNLKNHIKAHDNIKDQVCTGCHNAFRANGTLRRHMKTCEAFKIKTEN